MAKKKPAPPDWEAIEKEFRAGQLSNAEIARQHGITEGAIRKRAKAHRWEKDLSEQVRTRVNAQLVRDEVRASGTRVPDPEAVDAAARRGVEVVRSHRALLGRLHRISDALATRLEATIIGGESPAEWLGDRETLTDVADKLSRTTNRLVPLERQAFSLDAATVAAPAQRLTPEQERAIAREVLAATGDA